jgi:endonuclease/exonuclease/phosphatase family metal-dependent hydrolase
MYKPSLRFLEAASIFLFFLQALRVIFSVLFGIIYDQVFAGPMDLWLFASNLLVLAALVLPALAPRDPRPMWLALLAVLAALGRIALSVNDAGVRYWGALVVLATGGLYLAALLASARPLVLPGLVAALVLDQLLRVVGQTYDVSLRPGWLPIQALWAAALVLVAGWQIRRSVSIRRAYGAPGGLWGLAIGAFLFLETSLLSLPNAIARWSDGSYALLATLLIAVTLIPVAPILRWRLLQTMCHGRRARLALAGLLVLALLVGYFTKGAIPACALLVAQGAAMIGLACLLSGPPARLRSIGPQLALGLVLFLLLNFFNAFAFTYPYVLPEMRGLGWAVYLAAALVFGAALVIQRIPTRSRDELSARLAWPFAGTPLALAVALVAVWPRPAAPLPDTGTLRVGTYNIHYGYDADWHFTLEEIAQTIAASGADIVALQEVDTGRLTSYGVDDALYLARQLSMQAVYLPTVEHLTGIALLVRGPLGPGDGRLLASLQEQTGVVHATLEPGGLQLHAYGVWIGLSDEDTQTQIRQALDFTGSQRPAVFGGDFNSQPDSPVVQAIRQAGFVDPFIALGIDPPPTDPAIDPQIRIDYVWIRDLAPLRAWVSESLASDHRMVVVEVKVGH